MKEGRECLLKALQGWMWSLLKLEPGRAPVLLPPLHFASTTLLLKSGDTNCNIQHE